MTPWQAGVQLGPYVLIAPVGAGGMGEVWKARDPRVDRIVAIKRLKAEHAARFTREARAIAALNHPHICQLYDVGPDYLVMEYVDGTSLQGPVPVADAVRLAGQIADALAAAHRQGIVHRDLKPANIMVTAQGAAKLLDFGLAKFDQLLPSSDATISVALSEPGVIMGTVAYMSPEQAQGQAVDARSDVFSFGVVLYELVSGRRAFRGDTPLATITAVVNEEPPPLEAPAALARIVSRCLAKQPRARFQAMADVTAALEQAVVKPADQPPSIAVLPFANMSRDPDDEYFSDGLAEELINLLAHVPNLKVTARTSAFAFRGKEQDIRRIAEALGVRTILEGSVRRAGRRIRVTAQLINAEDGYHLWSERYDRELTDVFAIQDDIAQAIAGALELKLAPRATHKPGLPAYEALLKGRYHRQKFTSESHTRAKECFEQAIALDPQYAIPHAELAMNYLLYPTNGVLSLREVAPLIRAGAQRALELDPAETAPRFLLGAIAAGYDFDWKAAAGHFREAMASPAVSSEAHWAYATFYLSPLGRLHESADEMRRAVDQDPLNGSWRAILSNHLTCVERHGEAIEEALKVIEIDENHWLANDTLGWAYMATGRFAAAVATAERAHRVNPRHSLPVGLLAGALTRVGDTGRARDLIRQMGDSPSPVWGRVEYHLHCSEIDEAARWYEKMIEEREPFALVFARAPITRALRESPHWPRLARMMNLPESAA